MSLVEARSRMTQDDQHTLRLAASLIEAGASAQDLPTTPADGAAWQGLFLARRLRSTLGPEGAALAAERIRVATS